MTAVLEAVDVEVAFGREPAKAVDGVTLSVGAGAAIGIVGESGSGKTTVSRVLVGALEPTAGEVLVKGRRWTEVGARDPIRRSVQMVFQDPVASLNSRMTARQTVAEVLRHWQDLPRRLAAVRAGELLADVGLHRDAIDRRPSQLSGGQCQRVGIARALACEPDVLVADEPTSALDVSVQAQILNLLADLRAERGLALVLVSHDLGVIRHATDQALVMYRGKVVERGASDDLLERPAEPYTRLLVDSIPGRTRARNAVRRAAGL